VSLREIGEALGIALQSVRMFETGAHRVSASHLPVIARCLEVPIDALFTPASDPGAEAAVRVLSLSRNFLAIDDTDLQAAVVALSGALAAAAQRRGSGAALGDSSGRGRLRMKVYEVHGDAPRLVGRCEVPDDVGPVFEVPLFGIKSVIREQYTIGTVTHVQTGEAARVERAVLLSPGQPPEILPGWAPLTS
jgi:transcriptional regulator with XRE-family HTH domain